MKFYETQELKIYNSISGKKEVFKSETPGYVGMYVCGPTVYSKVHLGNCRTFISFDLVFRYLKHLGYKIRYVRNITDVGHLENDGETGEDRIAKKARLEQLEPMEIVQKYTVDFRETLRRFNNLPPSIEPTATGHIVEQIEATKMIIEKGLAYEANGSVYFDVMKYNESEHYGILSGRKLEDMIPNTRDLAAQSDKKNPQDFALWKKAEPEHIMRWPSPWGVGFPGWHLECTVMSSKYLGETFDIHGGGMDLKFPHHECEIAQGQATNGIAPVHYWMHANLLTLNGQKMAKSTGNNILPEELFSGENKNLSKGYLPSVARFFMMQANYRSVLDFSDEALLAAEKGFKRLMDAMVLLPKLPVAEKSSFSVKDWKQECYDAMNDDFNSPELIAKLFEAVRYINSVKADKATITKADQELLDEALKVFSFDILGLEPLDVIKGSSQDREQLEQVVELLISLRKRARDNRDFETSDKIRDELAEIGIKLKDEKDTTTYVL